MFIDPTLGGGGGVGLNRVAMAQGKQGIWMLTFPILLFKWQQGDGAFLCEHGSVFL